MSSISPVVSVTITLRIDNVREFVRNARARAESEGYSKKDARRTFTAFTLPACAQVMLDPCTLAFASIIESSSEES